MHQSAVPDARIQAGLAACAVCGAALEGPIAVRSRTFTLRTCPSCGSWTALPRPGDAEQAAIHDNADYFDHPYFKLRRSVTPSQIRRCRNVFSYIAAALDPASLRGQRLLDIGCDTGNFLMAAQQEFGIVPVGIDVAARAVRVARQQGVEAHRAAIEDAPAELTGFLTATAIDLIEHVPDPAAFLRQVRDRIRPGGALYLETPNIRSLVYRFGRALFGRTGHRLAGLKERLFPPQHIQYFTPESLGRLAQRTGYEVVRLNCRVLPSSDIAASLGARLAIGALQACDRLLGSEILVCAVLRRPLDSSLRETV
jgi:SAM-dependent methyltransferase